jgi:hypothetical protein
MKEVINKKTLRAAFYFCPAKDGFFLALETRVSTDRSPLPDRPSIATPGLAEGNKKVCPAQIPSINNNKNKQKQTTAVPAIPGRVN